MSSMLLWCVTLLIPTILGLLGYSFYSGEQVYSVAAVILIFFALAGKFIQWVLANRAKCPLCMTPSLAKKACSRHRNARPLCGSYRLRVATTILFKDYFRCPYCGEPSAMELRPGRRP